ncbi:hypothetical protein SAMN05660860_02363 [Geoalkalibacter ferrihydriticus]|uniref:Uncharacterized protein n=2 Tax=Geoalkalibacter ferrihydriticus TaxID=392333 RepID=A0A0C2HYZ6_9BACT|nr:hypothetical protein [Geoalkalibacter ferrihydriticus]KIH77977.1 hypothetical protein GFER_05060 [Geoalkalibacter ferrihydriticus DSM 17813]SDM34548.1 hypothetical protein SAMN05660860_02363 [Geoalkalibacter ferrihydriticus]
MAKFRDWVEPAHPAVMQRYEDLTSIFRFLREDVQLEVDKAFDRISRQIGFVVTTSLPVTLSVGDSGKIEGLELAAENLKGTLFEREFAAIFKRLAGKSIGKSRVAAGSYAIVFLWIDALKLKLKHDWVEPAHFRQIRPELFADLAKLRPGVREPAHWFNGAAILAGEEEVLISVIDEVYPELKLADRLAVSRMDSRKLIPGVREPAHFHQHLEGLAAEERIDPRKLIPGVREPAHFRKITDLFEDPSKLQALAELASLLRKLGF